MTAAVRAVRVVGLAMAAVALTVVGPGAGPAHAARLPAGACEYVTTINAPDGPTDEALAEVAVPASPAAGYGVFQRDMRAALTAQGRTTERAVRCGRSTVEVDVYRYALPIDPPKRVTTVYDRFDTDADGRVETFRVNGTPIAGRVVVGAGPPTVALGTDVALSSAYLVPPTGGEAFRTRRSLLVAVTATAPADGVRDLATGATVYRTATDELLAMNTIGQGSPLQPGTSSTWVMEFRTRRFGGTLVLPVVAGSAFAPTADTAPLEAARIPVPAPTG